MVKLLAMPDELSVVYGALSHEVRRGFIERLARGECTVAELREPLDISAAAVSKHLRVLTTAGLVERRRSGRHQVCRLKSEQLDDAGKWCREQRLFWSQTLDSLEAYLGEDPT
jgi:DNA-binding transcriptional ArsR family regulator